jgi:pre-mRNA-splicing factor SPF27
MGFMLCCVLARYELPKPVPSQKHDVAAWTEAVENSMAQLEHQAERYSTSG